MSTVAQPPLVGIDAPELTVAIASLALGGAERIVLDWAARVQPAWRVHVIVLRDHAHEWPVPPGVRLTRLTGTDVPVALMDIGRRIAHSDSPVCVCHLLTSAERAALCEGGAFVVPVVHNAREGWIEDAAALAGTSQVIAVSNAAAADLRRHGCDATISVIRHIPKLRRFARDARVTWRRAWRIPADATLVGMIGAVKPQKNYPFAVRLLRRLLDNRDVYLTIVGGPVGRHGREAWSAVLDAMTETGVRGRLAMPGFIADAAASLPAFDVLLNTSHYEGTSIASLEALVNGVPVVASRVGGQGELGSDGLTLVDKNAPLGEWASAVSAALEMRPSYPAWAGFPSFRLWTLAQLARPTPRNDRVLFVTANLNAGGAQRSLVNLAAALRAVRFEIAVTGDSTAEYFFDALRTSGINVYRTAASRDPFDHAERIVARVCAEQIGTVCFWNVDPKIKLLVTKALDFTNVALVDVSPGPSSFDEMRRTAEFGRTIAFAERDFYQRLDRTVLKYDTPAPRGCADKISVIPNGVPPPARVKASYDIAAVPRVVVNGRIAPTKFLVEVVNAMAIVRRAIPTAELHLLGGAEPRHADYAAAVRAAAGEDLDRTVFLHGASGDSVDRLADFDLLVVLGRDQGSPNALLEAMAAGLPCIANDDGGTGEQIRHEDTGLLLQDRTAETLAPAIVRLLSDRTLAGRLGCAGRMHALRSFSMDEMVARYTTLFGSLARARSSEEVTA
ncbi:MAG TPA: glycosyltransferase [Vicinamibacterales bacterium]|nr:glycosyltransferase [Vicinamibacterales bacterium]